MGAKAVLYLKAKALRKDVNGSRRNEAVHNRNIPRHDFLMKFDRVLLVAILEAKSYYGTGLILSKSMDPPWEEEDHERWLAEPPSVVKQ